MAGSGEGRRVAFELSGEQGPVAASTVVRDAPSLATDEVRDQLGVVRRIHGEQVGLGTTHPVLVRSIFVGPRRYDIWRTVEILEGVRALPETAAVPLVTWVLHVRAPGLAYTSAYLGPPFPVEGLESLAAERAADQLAVLDAHAYDGREIELEPYRRRAAARPHETAAHYELALMIWFHHFSGSPGPVLDAEPPLRRALDRSPRAHACQGLLGEVLLRGGRDIEAAQAFEAAARLRPRPPRYHYCASVALEKAGDDDNAKRALEIAKRVAGPRLKNRFTGASNPLEDYRFSLLKEVARLRKKQEGIVLPSDREIAERHREENHADLTKVPKDLHPILPLAEKWGLGDDTARDYFLRRATREDKAELRAAMKAYANRISAWLDSMGPEGIVTPEAGCFLYLLEACAELGLSIGKTRG